MTSETAVVIGPTVLATRALGGGSTVVISGLSGIETAGTVGGIVGVLAALITLYVTISANNRAKEREYRDEIRQAEQRGADQLRVAIDGRIRNLVDELQQARHEADFFRDKYFEVGGRATPPPRPGNGEGDQS